jgi:hypothetical protein
VGPFEFSRFPQPERKNGPSTSCFRGRAEVILIRSELITASGAIFVASQATIQIQVGLPLQIPLVDFKLSSWLQVNLIFHHDLYFGLELKSTHHYVFATGRVQVFKSQITAVMSINQIQSFHYPTR